MTSMFDVARLLPKSGALGSVPTTRQAYKDVLTIALPAVAEMVLMSLIGSIDTMMVGTLGPAAIASVGLVAQPRMLMLSIFFALNVGVTAIVARRKGEERRQDANRILRNALVLMLGLSLVITALSMIFSRRLMQLAGAGPDTIDDAEVYFRIMMLFLPANTMTLAICAAQRGVGDTRITMYVNILSNLVNVVFNYLLIGGNWGFPRLEVAGAAWASVIGLTVGFLLSIYTIAGKGSSGFLCLSRHDDWRPSIEAIVSIIRIGGNAMLEQVALRVGFFLYARIVAELGTLAFAAHQICLQFLTISFNFGDGIGVAGTSLVGQMLGKKRPDLAHLYGKAAQRIALVVALLLAASIVLFRRPLVMLFTKDEQVVGLASMVMLMVAAFQPFQTTAVVLSGALRGAGDNRYVAKVMLLCVAVMRPVFAVASIYALVAIFHRADIALMGAWAASLVDITTRMTLVYRRFNGGKWHAIQL